MNGVSINVQDALLLEWQKGAAPLRLTMIHGEVVLGTIKRFDRFALVLGLADGRRGEMLVYKHAIASVQTSVEG